MRGWFAVGVWHPKSAENIGTLIRSAHAFGASFVFTIGRRYQRQSSAVRLDRHIPVLHFDSLDQVKTAMPTGARVVAVELNDRATPLPCFSHPPAAAYLLGAEDHGLSAEVMRGLQVVSVPGGSSCLNVATAGSIVMYDRIARSTWRQAPVSGPSEASC